MVEAHEPADVVVRIGSPVDLAPAPGAGTFVMASHGAGSTVNAPMVGGANIGKAIAVAPETMLLTLSAFARQGLMAQGVPEDRIAITPRGIDPGFFRPPSDLERENLRERFADRRVRIPECQRNDRQQGHRQAYSSLRIRLGALSQARLVLKGVDSIYRSKDRLTGLRRVPAEIAAAVEPHITYIVAITS